MAPPNMAKAGPSLSGQNPQVVEDGVGADDYLKNLQGGDGDGGGCLHLVDE